jgi:hypothetical protein
VPTTIDALVILVLLIVPGFVFARLVRAPMPRALVSDKNFLVRSLVFSLVIHAIALPFTMAMSERISNYFMTVAVSGTSQPLHVDGLVFIWLATLLLLLPILLALIVSRIWEARWAQPFLERLGVSLVDMTPRAWDWFFLTQKRGCWIVAELKDGRMIGSEYGEFSFASLNPHGNDPYVETEYYVDERHTFFEKVPDSIGVWLNGSEIRSVHFYRADEPAGA